MCLIHPNTLPSLRGLANTIPPHVHLDVFDSPRREEGLPSRGGKVRLAAHMHLMQPRWRDLGWLEVHRHFEPMQPYASAG